MDKASSLERTLLYMLKDDFDYGESSAIRQVIQLGVLAFLEEKENRPEAERAKLGDTIRWNYEDAVVTDLSDELACGSIDDMHGFCAPHGQYTIIKHASECDGIVSKASSTSIKPDDEYSQATVCKKGEIIGHNIYKNGVFERFEPCK